MNAISASPADATQSTLANRKILVWDAPVRVFHWLLVVTFVGAWLTAESESWRLIHITLGYTMAGLVAFRILWGMVGTRYARFSNFVQGPTAVKEYARGILRGRPAHHTGHNPAGAMAILALMALAITIVASGWAMFNDIGGNIGGKWLEDGHEVAATAMLVLVGVHIAGAIVSSWLHRENLVGAMISGHKSGRPEDGVRSAWYTVAILMIVVVLGFWGLQWKNAPGAGLVELPAAAATDRSHDRHQS